MAFQLAPATPDDIPGIANCAYRAFRDDALETAVFPPAIAPPDSNPGVAFRQVRIGTALPSPNWHYVVATVPSHDGSRRIAGFAAWAAPHTPDPKKLTPGELVFPGVDVGALQYATEIIESARKEILGAETTNVWYLASLAVDPDFQGKGIASKLVRWGLDKADRDGKAAYLESSPAAAGVYRRQGFREVGKRAIVKDRPDFLATLMKREPASS